MAALAHEAQRNGSVGVGGSAARHVGADTEPRGFDLTDKSSRVVKMLIALGVMGVVTLATTVLGRHGVGMLSNPTASNPPTAGTPPQGGHLLVDGKDTCWEDYTRNIDSTKHMKFIPGKTVMMDTSSVKLMCELLKPHYNILEWGSGGSTLFFHKYVRSWSSIEHDAAWYKEMLGFTANITNVNMYTAPHTWSKKPGHVGPDDGLYEEFVEYVELPAKWGKRFDVVIVDGRVRVHCARSAMRNHLLTPDGVVVMHDWERKFYKYVLQNFDQVAIDRRGHRHMGVLRPKVGGVVEQTPTGDGNTAKQGG